MSIGAIAAGVGQVVASEALGAGVQHLKQGKTGRQFRKHVRKQLAGIDRPEGDIRSAADQAQNQAVTDQVLGAQAQMLNQQAMAGAGGAPQMTGAQQQAAQEVARTGQESAVKQTSEQNRLRQGMRAMRQARLENLGFQGAKLASQDAAAAGKAAGQIGSTLWG